ncbi:MAG: GNAT family N-acetyltransferase, partial [Bacteroidota bacterium]
FMGLFIVHPGFRGQGIGRKLWYLRRNLLLDRLKEGAAIGMDGVVAMQPFYAKGGFKIAFKDERYECIGQKLSYSEAVSTIREGDFEQITAYDLRSLGYNRQKFLKNWLLNPDSLSFKYSTDNGLSGYATIRNADQGYKIGPLFADSDEIAEELYRACLNWAAGEAVFLDIPMVNKGAVALVEKYDAKYVFECARMYLGKPIEMNMDKVFGITTFELG